MKLRDVALVALLLAWAYTCVKLTETRHEVRKLRGEVTTVTEDVTEHDEMLETLGDDLDFVEVKVGIDREARQK